MKQISLKLKSYAGSVNIVDNNDLQRRVLQIMLFSLAALAVFYVLILGNMVFNITERRNLEADARRLSNEVADLQLVYLSMANKVDVNLGYLMGFKEIKAKFAIRKSLGSLGSVTKLANDL